MGVGFSEALIEDYLASRLGVIKPHVLIALRRRAVRLGLWWRVKPLRRALVDSVIMYIRRGGVVKSPSLLAQLRQAAIEVLVQILAGKLTLVAYLIGVKLVGKVKGLVANGVRDLVALGIMWLNTPNWYRPDI